MTAVELFNAMSVLCPVAEPHPHVITLQLQHQLVCELSEKQRVRGESQVYEVWVDTVRPRLASFLGAGSPEQRVTLMSDDDIDFYNVDIKVMWKAWCDNIVNQDIRPSVAVKNLAIAQWGSSTLLQRTVTGVASNARLNKDSRPPLTPKKVAFLKDECKLSHVIVT
ncbi:hypothetical protein HPB47_022374 [Ixodes persulcatus]|uniref:Uncharacterized protein n=1 Tax=Ixodes persulcatus TaxID=34615 RepID=A0AC60QA97_IXOPE|nr:hypothetical protein HPB47_022374 [Ixodes persulcatus]